MEKLKLKNCGSETTPSVLQVMHAHLDFSLNTFKRATSLSALTHLIKEVGEVVHEINVNGSQEKKAEEYADCLGCVLDSAAREGITPLELIRAFAAKIEVNKLREWSKNTDGTYSHIKP